MKSVGRKPRRIAVAILFVIVIAIMWINKDALGLWSNISSEDLLQMLADNAFFIIAKIAVFVGIVYIIKKIAAKIKSK